MELNPADRIRQLEARVQQLEADLARRQLQITELEQRWERWLKLISHDFRGPLTLILGYTQSLQQQVPVDQSSETTGRDLAATVAAAQRLDKMIGEMVDAARIEARILTLLPTEIELPPLVRGAVQAARRKYAGRSIQASIAPNLPPVLADARRVRQIIAALLSNAVLFSSNDSRVVVSVDHTPSQATISVADQGLGLTQPEISRLYEKFYRPERARDVRREGLGLSLMVAAELATLMQGRLWVESRGADQGSTFYLNLPVIN